MHKNTQIEVTECDKNLPVARLKSLKHPVSTDRTDIASSPMSVSPVRAFVSTGKGLSTKS